MVSRKALAKTILEILSQGKEGKRCLIGFDGFTDEIIEVVDQRQDSERYTPLLTISDLSERIRDSSGKSCGKRRNPRSECRGDGGEPQPYGGSGHSSSPHTHG